MNNETTTEPTAPSAADIKNLELNLHDNHKWLKGELSKQKATIEKMTQRIATLEFVMKTKS